MATASKACFDCGTPLVFGVAQCSYCGARAATVFDENAPAAMPDSAKRWKNVPKQMDDQTKLEKAQDRANNSLIMALASFFPLFGIALGIAALIYATFSMRTLREMNVEDGRGSATAGLVIGSLGLVAQICLITYAMKLLSIVKL